MTTVPARGSGVSVRHQRLSETAAKALTSDPSTTAERPNRPLLEAFPGSHGGLQRAYG